LVNISECLHGEFDMISPTRELIKEGKIKLISSSSGDIMDRYVFLVRQLLTLRYLQASKLWTVHFVCIIFWLWTVADGHLYALSSIRPLTCVSY